MPKKNRNGMATPGEKREGEKPAKFRKPPVEFTEARKEQYLEILRASGLKYMSAKAAGVSYITVEQHKKADPEFAEACELALQERLDELENAAFTRAIDGVDEPVIGGKDRDQIITSIRRYSDGLMTTLLKAHRAAYRERQEIDHNFKGGGVLVVGVAAKTDQEWEAEHGEAAKGTHRPPLPGQSDE